MLAVQWALQALFFPWAALWDSAPLYYIDSPFHHYQMEMARQLCAVGQLTGYDPFFAGGQGAGVAANLSGKLHAALACLSTANATEVAAIYKHASFWLGVLGPMLLVSAALLLHFGTVATAVLALFTLLLWWTGALRWYHTAGMVSYVFIACAVVPFVLATVRVCREPRPAATLALSLAAAVGMWIHPLFPVAASLIGLPLLLPELRSLRAWGRALVVVGTLAMVMVGVNAPWVLPTFQAAGSTFGLAYQANVEPLLAAKEALGIASTAAGGSLLYLALMTGALLAWVTVSGRDGHALRRLTVSALLLMVWASVGALVPAIGLLQPNRFSALAWLCLAVPAATGVAAAALRWRELASPWARGGALLGLASVGLVSGFFVRELYREVLGPPSIGRYAVAPPEVKGLGATSQQIIEYLRANTHREGRVLFETSLGRVHDRAHMAGVIALLSDREFIGGPYPGTDFASAWDGVAFGGEIERFTPEQLEVLLDAYNVGWILCHTKHCAQAASRVPGVTEGPVLGPVTAYTRSALPGLVVRGQAHLVDRCADRLELDAVSGPTLVLRYHWIPGLRSLTGGRVEPIELVPGARPFVAVHDPPTKLVLSTARQDGASCVARRGAVVKGR